MQLQQMLLLLLLLLLLQLLKLLRLLLQAHLVPALERLAAQRRKEARALRPLVHGLRVEEGVRRRRRRARERVRERERGGR